MVEFPYLAPVSSALGISQSSLAFPAVIFDVILPFIFVWYVIYLLLGKIGIFRYSSIWVNAIIGLAPALFLIRFGGILLWPALYVVIFLKVDSWKWKIIGWIALTIFLLFIIPYL